MVEPRRRFRFLKELAEGAFGKVYVAEMITAEGFSSVVAIKLLHGKWAGHQEIAQRSRDEARLLGLLHHRNIVRVEDLTSINGQCAVVMEYLEGVDLKTLISYCRDNGVRLPRRVAFEITAAIAGALDSAYNQVPMRGGEPLQVIHRDIKPSNVMVTAPGDVKVLDFGTARANFEEREAKTQALAFGSQAYMAPERLLGDPDTPAGDVFSLGVNLFELLTFQSFGKIFIRAERYENALEERLDMIDLSDLPQDTAELIRDVMRRMLSYDNTARPSSGEVVDLMDNISDLVNDGSLQRFCRQVVRPALESVEPPQSPDDPLTGSTLFEDRGSGPRSLIPMDNSAGEEPLEEEASADGASEEAWSDQSEQAADVDLPRSNYESAGRAPVTWSPPAELESEPEPEPEPVHSAPADAWRPPSAVPPVAPPVVVSPPVEPAEAELPSELSPVVAPPVAVSPVVAPPVAVSSGVQSPAISPPAPPKMSAQTRIPQSAPARPAPAKATPEKSGAGKGLIVAGVVVALLAMVGVGVGLALKGSGDPVPEEPVAEAPKPGPTEAPAPPGGRYEVGPLDAGSATVKLTLATPSKVSVDSVSSEFKQEWDGTGTLELVGLPAGSYRTRVDHEGKQVRSTLKVDGGKTCSFTFDASKGDAWEAVGCE